MPSLLFFGAALAVQLVAQAVGAGWGAALGGALIGIALRRSGAFRTGFLAALVAAGLLLLVHVLRGAPLLDFADRLGGNFSLPGWALLLLTMLLPALQAAGFAGGVARLVPRQSD